MIRSPEAALVWLLFCLGAPLAGCIEEDPFTEIAITVQSEMRPGREVDKVVIFLYIAEDTESVSSISYPQGDGDLSFPIHCRALPGDVYANWARIRALAVQGDLWVAETETVITTDGPGRVEATLTLVEGEGI